MRKYSHLFCFMRVFMSSIQESSNWKKQSGFILSLLGSAVGFGNILSFSAVCYKNGGGAFLIPYFIALFVLGIPVLFLEGLIGARLKKPLVSAYNAVVGMPGRTVGWFAIFACFTVGAFYAILTGYMLAYSYFMATSSVGPDSAHFFKHEFLHLSNALDDWGAFSWSIFCACICVVIYCWCVLVRNIQTGIEKVCSFFMPLLISLIILFACASMLMPGGSEGLIYFLRPDFSKLLDPFLWRDIFGQLLFSLSLGLGIIVGYSRHTDEKVDIAKSMYIVAIGDFIISFIAGIAIFGAIAHMSATSGIPFDEIVKEASTFEIGFVIFPKILVHIAGSYAPILGAIFFFCLFLKGSAGLFSIIESVAGNVQEEFQISRKKAVSIIVCFVSVAALFFSFGNALYLIDTLASFVLGTVMLISCLTMIGTFCFKYSSISSHPLWDLSQSRKFLRLSLLYLVPVLLLCILIGNLWKEMHAPNNGSILCWSWFIIAAILSLLFAKGSRRSQEVVSKQPGLI